MTPEERKLVEAVLKCNVGYGRGTFKRYMREQLRKDKTPTPMFVLNRNRLIWMAHRYRRQIPDYKNIILPFKANEK